MLSIYDWLLGIALISAVVLSLFAGIIALMMFGKTTQKRYLRSWKFMIMALGFFILQEIIASLKIFGIFSTPYLTHIIPSFILVLLIAAVVMQINITKGYD